MNDLEENNTSPYADVPALQSLCRNIILRPDPHALVEKLATDMAITGHERFRNHGEFHVALSGGSTPQLLYQVLMIDPRFRLFPWRSTHLWIVDDRCVDFQDDRSNFKMITELIVDHSDIPKENVHPMPVLESAGDLQYEKQLRHALGQSARLDFVLLGMGADAHTASLFPRTPAIAEQQRWVVFNDGESVASPRPRMTMTYPLINTARRIAILVTGASKYATLTRVAAAVQSGEADAATYPITGVRCEGEDTQLTWYLDEPAATGQTHA